MKLLAEFCFDSSKLPNNLSNTTTIAASIMSKVERVNEVVAEEKNGIIDFSTKSEIQYLVIF